MTHNLDERLKNGLLIFDGAMGTEIYKRNYFINTCFDELCLSAPDIIKEIHTSYFEAGADVLTANSYGANRNKLSKFGLAEKLVEINMKAVQLARDVGGDTAMVAGSVGPLGRNDSPVLLKEKDAIGILSEHALALEKAGADFIIFETIPTLQEAHYAFRAAQMLSIPYMLSFAVDRSGESSNGEPLSKLLTAIGPEGHHPSAIGINCGLGPEGALTVLEQLVKLSRYPIIVQPNAGMPKNVEGRMIYMASPEYFSTYALRFINLGARGIGGCCGTTPEHIRDTARVVRPVARSAGSSQLSFIKEAEKSLEPVPLERKSSFGAKLKSDKWLTSV